MIGMQPEEMDSCIALQHLHDDIEAHAQWSDAERTKAHGGPKFGLTFHSKRVTVPRTHFLYAVVQYTQVRTSTTVSSQSTSGEPRNLAASPQPKFGELGATSRI